MFISLCHCVQITPGNEAISFCLDISNFGNEHGVMVREVNIVEMIVEIEKMSQIARCSFIETLDVYK